MPTNWVARPLWLDRAVNERRLSCPAASVWCAIYDATRAVNDIQLSQPYLARSLGLSLSTVERSVRELKAVKLLRVQRDPRVTGMGWYSIPARNSRWYGTGKTPLGSPPRLKPERVLYEGDHAQSDIAGYV